MKTKLANLKEQQRKLSGWLNYNSEEIKKEMFSYEYDRTIIRNEVLKQSIKQLTELYVESKLLRRKLKNSNLKSEDRDSIESRLELLRLQGGML